MPDGTGISCIALWAERAQPQNLRVALPFCQITQTKKADLPWAQSPRSWTHFLALRACIVCIFKTAAAATRLLLLLFFFRDNFAEHVAADGVVLPRSGVTVAVNQDS